MALRRKGYKKKARLYHDGSVSAEAVLPLRLESEMEGVVVADSVVTAAIGLINEWHMHAERKQRV